MLARPFGIGLDRCFMIPGAATRDFADARRVDIDDRFNLFAARPDLFNYNALGLGRVVTPEAWLSTWSGLSSYANLARNMPKVTIPTFVVGAMADQDIFVSDIRTEYELSGAADKRIEFIDGADHYMRAGGKRAEQSDPRPRLMKLLTEWTRERFAP